MKIREGFVSNSSSSSFMALVRKIDKDEITEENKNRIRIHSDNEFGEGYPYWKPDKETLEFIQKSKKRNFKPFILVEELISAEDGSSPEMNKEMLPTITKIALSENTEYEFAIFEKSNHSPEFEEFKGLLYED